MSIPITQWEAVGGVAHAWIAQCEGYVSLCGHEVSGFGGQRSGIRCGLCATSAGWAVQTGESSYWTPHGPMIVERRDPQPQLADFQEVRQRQGRRASRRRVVPETTIVEDRLMPALRPPDTLEAYQQLPALEQRYWAPLMLARAGHEAVWNQTQETAEQFQQRCYAQLVTQGTS